jgi:hypothetical protein
VSRGSADRRRPLYTSDTHRTLTQLARFPVFAHSPIYSAQIVMPSGPAWLPFQERSGQEPAITRADALESTQPLPVIFEVGIEQQLGRERDPPAALGRRN